MTNRSQYRAPRSNLLMDVSVVRVQINFGTPHAKACGILKPRRVQRIPLSCVSTDDSSVRCIIRGGSRPRRIWDLRRRSRRYHKRTSRG